MAEAELRERVVSLETALTHANSLAHTLTSQVALHCFDFHSLIILRVV